MIRAGYLLVGGRSRRMGQDKALLPLRGEVLAAHLARTVAAAAGSVVLIGDPERYRGLGLHTIPDAWPHTGPLGGIATALRHSTSRWNLVLACDMPRVTPAFLRQVLDWAEASGADCLLPAGPSGLPEPLCAAYHARCLAVIEAALAGGVRKITDALAGTRMEIRRYDDDAVFQNCNTPEEWSDYIREDAGAGDLDER